MDALINDYISSLNEQERLVMSIAEEHLDTSFDIEKSIGFQYWYQKHNKSSKVEENKSSTVVK